MPKQISSKSNMIAFRVNTKFIFSALLFLSISYINAMEEIQARNRCCSSETKMEMLKTGEACCLCMAWGIFAWGSYEGYKISSNYPMYDETDGTLAPMPHVFAGSVAVGAAQASITCYAAAIRLRQRRKEIEQIQLIKKGDLPKSLESFDELRTSARGAAKSIRVRSRSKPQKKPNEDHKHND